MYSSSTLALRAKGSFSQQHHQHHHHHVYSFNDRAAAESSCCGRCSLIEPTAPSFAASAAATFSTRSLLLNPRFLYGYWLRQSTFIRWSPSRRFVSGGVAASRYCRLTTACDLDRSLAREWRKWSSGGRISCGVPDSDGSFQEMLGLLAEVEEYCMESASTRRGGTQESKVGLESSRRDFGRASKKEDSLKEDDQMGRRSGSSSSYHSALSSSSGDFGSDEVTRRRIANESSISNGRNDGIAGREVRKYENNGRLGRRSQVSDSIVGLERDSKQRESRIREREESATSVDSDRRAREEYVREDERLAGHRELPKLTRTSQVRESSTTVRDSSNKKVFNAKREDVSTLAVDLLEEVRRQRSEIDQLRKGYQELIRTTEMQDSDIMRASSSSRVLNTRLEDGEESSATALILIEEVRRQRSEIEQLRKNYQKLMRTSEICESDIEMASSSKKVINAGLEDREGSSTSAANLVEETSDLLSNMDQQISGRADSRRSSQKLTELDQLRKTYQKLTRTSEIHNSDIERISNPKKVLNARSEHREESSTSAENLVEEMREQRSSMDQRIIGRADSRRSSQKFTEIAEVRKSDTESASRSQRYETSVKDREDISTSVHDLIQVAGERNTQTDQQVVSVIRCGETDRASSSKRLLVTGTDIREENSASVVNLADGTQDQWNEAGGRVTQQLRSRKDSQRNSKLPEFFESNKERVSNPLKSSSTRINNREEDSPLMLVYKTQGKEKANLIEGKRSAERVPTLEAFSGSSDSGYSSGQTHAQKLDDQIRRDEFHLVREDALDSASRLDKSSLQFVGEFVNQLQQEISASDELDIASKHSSEIQMGASQTSAVQKRNVPGDTEKYKDEKYKQGDPSQSSAGSEVKGPSDEMWDVRGASSQEPCRREEPEKDSSITVLESTGAPASIGNAIVKRSSRSLWSYLADIVRMGWRPRAESHKSTLQSGTRSSSNESVSSDAWYSGHEPDDDEEENVKKGRRGMQKESMLIKRPTDQPHLRTSPSPSQEASEATRLEDRVTQVESDAPISIGSFGRVNASKGSSLVPGLENLGWIEGEKERRDIPYAVVTAGPRALLASTSMPTYEEETEIDRIQNPEIGFIKSEQEPIREKIAEVRGVEGKDGDLKRRKLQRNKQVLREQFDEWEEAYKLESEQRKTDEIFMREALLEAKKAAGTWEVPVGAVLVQNGKIIARGCNLVEELRDSTAHAEMICIREASNLLRTWRLAETTLYVTLEPCPMCAGAILQARIDTVVWGAPNRLLGADGSWVRLFPGGDEGKNSLDQSNQTVGPVHPFHPKITIRRGVLASECADVMQQFFQLRRKKNKKTESPPSCLPINYPTKLLTKMHDIFCMMSCM